jgi:hypothetical protein
MVTAVVEHGPVGTLVRRVAGEDTYIPLGPAANQVLPSTEQIVAMARELLDG